MITTPFFHRFLLTNYRIGIFCSICFLFQSLAFTQTNELPDNSPKTPSKRINVPEKYQKIWPMIAWFYEDILEGDEDEIEMASVLPDSIKHPIIPPLLFFPATIGFLVGSLWFLISQFQVSLSWGLGQILANAASCLLIIPGLVVSIVFMCLHWKEARTPFAVLIISFVAMVASLFLVPSWAIPVK